MIAKPTTPATDPAVREEFLRWVFATCGSLLLYWLSARIAIAFYHPDIDALKDTASRILIEADKVRPEPMESFLFRLSVLVVLPSLAIFYKLLSGSALIRKLSGDVAFTVISFLVVAALSALIYFDMAAINPYGPAGGDMPQIQRDTESPTNFSYYFGGLFLGNYLWAYLLIIVPAMAFLFFIGIRKKNWETNKVFRSVSSVTGYGIIVAVVVAIVAMNTFNMPYTAENKYDFNAVYYAMTQVYAGVPMLVNGFTDTYGLYPHFLNILFKVSGLSVVSFSLVLSLLTAVCFLLNFYTLRKLVESRTIFFLGAASILFFPYINYKLVTIFDAIFSYYPIRYLVPATIITLMQLYLTKRKRSLYLANLFVAAAFVLWNPEMGLVCYLSVVAVHIYADLYTDGRLAYRTIVLHAVRGAVILPGVVYAYKLLIYLFYGAWPDMSLLFSTIFVFSKVGFGLLPMSLVHPWNVMALVLMAGFLYAIAAWCRKETGNKPAMVLLLSLIGLGYFAYFQGRSQNSNFALSSGYAIFLLTILGDELWQKAMKTDAMPLKALFVLFLGVSSFSMVELVAGAERMPALIAQEDDKNAQLQEQQQIETNAAFIEANTAEHEWVYLMMRRKNQGLLLNGSKRRSAFNPGLIDLFLKKDIERLEHQLIYDTLSVFAETENKTYPFLSNAFATIASTREAATTNGKIMVLYRRKAKIPGTIFFDDSVARVLYRKYTDDSTGISQRVRDATGIAHDTLSSVFSVQLLFYSSPQMGNDPTLLADADDKSERGFIIGSITNTRRYLFMINSVEYQVPTPENEWIYYVLNVLRDKIEIYRNGVLLFTRPLTEPFHVSYKKMSIGNIGGPGVCRYFYGAISEVSVANRTIDSANIGHTWRKIADVVKK